MEIEEEEEKIIFTIQEQHRESWIFATKNPGKKMWGFVFNFIR